MNFLRPKTCFSQSRLIDLGFVCLVVLTGCESDFNSPVSADERSQVRTDSDGVGSHSNSSKKLLMTDCIDPDLNQVAEGVKLTLCNGDIGMGTSKAAVSNSTASDELLDCSSEGEIGCKTTDKFKPLAVDNILASDIRYGAEILGVTGSAMVRPPDCSSAGSQNCVAMGSYVAASTCGDGDSNCYVPAFSSGTQPIRAIDFDQYPLGKPVNLSATTAGTATESPTAVWNTPYEAGDGVVFELSIGTTAGATDIFPWTNIGFVTSYQATSLTLLEATNYYTSIRALDHLGRTSAVETGVAWQINYTSCKDIIDSIPSAADGDYQIDPDGSGGLPAITVNCDMTTDGGGWTLILNYNHEGGTNPATTSLGGAMPLKGSDTVGTDESATQNWGHTAPSYLANFTVNELRFFCQSSSHVKTLDLKTSEAGCLSYVTSGAGSCSNMTSDWTTLPGHTAVLPTGMLAMANQGIDALTNHTFYIGGANHWNIRASGDRWECDDYPGNDSADTLHRVWFR